MAFAREKKWLFANNAVAINMAYRAAAIGNPPVPCHQLHRFCTAILDADMVGPEPTPLGWRGLLL